MSAQTGVSAEDVAARDQLIADQENLLNTYRCLFGTDTDLVPGGCDNPDTISPGAAPQNPTQNDLDVRDRLIQSQEALLNTYRCQHNIDTQLVPNGCPDSQTTQPDTEPTTQANPASQYTAISAGNYFSCAIKIDQTIACWDHTGHVGRGKAWNLGDSPAGQYTAIAAGWGYWCAFKTDITLVCWNDNQNGDGKRNSPAGQYTAIASSETHSCAIKTDKTIACWHWYPPKAPSFAGDGVSRVSADVSWEAAGVSWMSVNQGDWTYVEVYSQ